jgi:IS1 family transposase
VQGVRALLKKSQQVVAYAVGGRGADICQKLKQNIPPAYSHAQIVSDLWEVYKPVFGEDHRCVGKDSGETAHVERWNNTLRQHLGRFVRKTLSFSKTEENHEASLKLLIHEYNMAARHEYLSG